MVVRLLTLAAAAAVVGACERASGPLPYETRPEEAVTRTIGPDSGGTITKVDADGPGISLAVPPGAVSDPTDVTLARFDAADLGGAVAGAVLDSTTFSIAPAGLTLDAAAAVDLFVDAAGLSPEEQLGLAAFAVPDGEDGRIVHLPTRSIDLTSGILRANIERFGAVGARISPDLLELEPGREAEGMTGGSLMGDDGGGGGGGGAPADTAVWSAACDGAACVDRLELLADPELADRYGGMIAGLDLAGSTTLTFVGDDESGIVSGTVDADWELRVRTAGAVAAAPLRLSIDLTDVGLAYEIGDHGIRVGELVMPYRIEQDADGRVLVLELPPTGVAFHSDDVLRDVVVIVRLRLREVAG
ncbi:MAG: hypothetical protein ACODAE_02010 [Gemmatimonadota bacterium]